MYPWEHEVPCMCSSCRKRVVVNVYDDGLVLCLECEKRFRKGLREGYPGMYDIETFENFTEENGTVLQEKKDMWKGLGIDMDDFLDREQ